MVISHAIVKLVQNYLLRGDNMDIEDLLLIFCILGLFFLFQGDPDIFDVLRLKVMQWLQ